MAFYYSIITFAIIFASVLTQAIALSLTPDHQNGLRTEDHTRLTQEKRIKLEELRARVLPKLTQDFMKEDLYLLRFLDAKNLDVEKAELMVLNHLEYREENKLDTAKDEDWSDLEKNYPYRIAGVDKLGRPLIQCDFGKWDLNKAANEGKRNRLNRYFNKMMDEATMKVIELQSQGLNITQWVGLGNMLEVNMQQHIGMKESLFYYDWTTSLEQNFPGMSSHILLLNSPTIFTPVSGIIKSIMSEKTKAEFKQFGEPKEWKHIVDNLIDSDQLPSEYGGTKGTQQTPHLLVGAFQRKKDGTWWWFG